MISKEICQTENFNTKFGQTLELKSKPLISSNPGRSKSKQEVWIQILLADDVGIEDVQHPMISLRTRR